MQRALLLLGVVALIPRASAAQGEPVGPEFRVNTYTTGDLGGPAVASDASGNFVVVWHNFKSQDGSTFGVFGQRYASTGEPLGPEFRVNTYTMNAQRSPAVASDSSGNFVVVWSSWPDQDGSGDGVFGQRYASTGAPLGPEFRVSTYTTGLQTGAEVASDPSGNFVVVWWSHQDGSGYGVFGQRYAGTGEPLGPEFRVNTYTTSSQVVPAVASDSSGNFVVLWRSDGQDGSNYGVFGQVFASSGVALGPEFRVNRFTTGEQWLPSIAANASGNFVVVWTSANQDGSSYGIFGKRCCSSTGALAPEFRVNTYTSHAQGFPEVASDASGNFVVAWQRGRRPPFPLTAWDDSSRNVFGQRYASTGEPLGPEFRVNTYTTSFQLYPAVASDASGNFVVVWTSYNQDGSDWGVFGQRYSGIGPVE